jgi:hypothetical protein
MNESAIQIGIDRLLLTYIFDPDEGLAEEITEHLNHMAQSCEYWEALKDSRVPHLAASAQGGLEVAEADLVFYTEVWAKIRTAKGEQVIPEPEAKRKPLFSLESQMGSDIGLHDFLVSCGQIKYENSMEQRQGLAKELISRGWKK